MNFGDRTLSRGAQGQDVEELQLRLAGFRGTLWDGDFGPNTERQVLDFQREYMGMETPNGIVDATTFQAIDRFAAEFPIPFSQLRCPCGECNGFGQGRFKGLFRSGGIQERFHRYEYPGIHKAILHAYRTAKFFVKKHDLGETFLTSGYRCHVRNTQTNRSSTNHMGKALDFDITRRADIAPGSEEDRDWMNRIRSLMGQVSEFQVGWAVPNRKALEPGTIAPTWVHMDVREYKRERFLQDRFFVQSEAELDAKVLREAVLA